MPAHAFAASMVYHHGSDGAPIEGSLNALVTALQAGEEVAIGYKGGQVRWLRTCANVSFSSENTVSCYVTEVLDTVVDGGSNTFQKPPAVEAHIFDTTGFHAGIKKHFHTGEALPIDPPDQRELWWYAR